MNSQIAVEEALSTLKEIRGIINKAQEGSNPEHEKRRLALIIIVQCAALLVGGFFWMSELYGSMTREFAQSAVDTDFRIQGLVSLACGLFFMTAVLYCLIRIEAKNSEDTLQGYLSKNFPALITLNFFSDLLVKYTAVSVVVLALKPDFVAPLLLVFLADYLLQRRFFVLPLTVGIPAAVALLGIAFMQIKDGSPSLFFALSAFCALSVSSAAFAAFRLLRLKQQRGA